MFYNFYRIDVRTRLFAFTGDALRMLSACAVAVVGFTAPVTAQAQQATFTPLGLFGGSSSGASDISADGSVIVGTSSGPGSSVSAFRLTPHGSALRTLGLTGSEVSGEVSVSDDGSTVVGTFRSTRGEEAFRWVGDGPLEGIGGGTVRSNALDVSGDGSVVVGSCEIDSRSAAFRWTASGGLVALGGDEVTARGVSADGSTLVGNLGNVNLAYRWTMQTGSVTLPPIGSQPPQARLIAAVPLAVTADGSVVVGYNSFVVGNSGYFDAPFRWTEEEGTISLGSAFTYISSLAVSAGGSVVVGSEYTPATTPRAFMWTAETGKIGLRDALIFGGATNLDGWSLLSARGISADGRTVAGTALRESDGHREAFVATIGAVPEPSTIVLVGFAIGGLICFLIRRRSRRRAAL